MKPEYLKDDEPEKGSLLSSVRKENPFLVPENYFDSLPGNIMKKIDALPDIDRMKKENPFLVPDGYFESLASTVQRRIADEKKKNILEEWISVLLRPKYSLSFAAAIVILILGIKYFTKSPDSEPRGVLSYTEVRNSDYMADLDESTLVDILEQENKDENINEDSGLEQYLMDNDIDVYQIENRL
jgi:hypothetical protein